MILGPLVTALAAAVAVQAPVTSVTVYSDRARVTRTATIPGGGAQRLQLPLLRDGVDSSTIRVEGSCGAVDVQRVEIAHVEADEPPADEARDLLAKLQKVDDQILHARADSGAAGAVLEAIRRLAPAP